MRDGFYLMHRGWADSDVFANEPYSERDAWIWIIEQAAWSPTSTRVKGSTIDLDRGQLCFAQRFLAEKWQWSKSRVDRFLKRLAAEGMISVCSKSGAENGATPNHAAGQGQSIITVCNYAKYQDLDPAKRGNSGAASGATAGQQRGNSGAKNKEKNEGNESSEAKASSVARASKPVFHRLPSNWHPTKPLSSTLAERVALWPPGKLNRELEQLQAWAANAPDVNGKGRKLDWDQAWQNWLRRADDERQSGNRIGGGKGDRRDDGFLSALREVGGR